MNPYITMVARDEKEWARGPILEVGPEISKILSLLLLTYFPMQALP